MKYGLMLFSELQREGPSNPYEFVSELSGFADRQGFEAIWFPERHFNPVGGNYPNPAIAAAYVAARTSRIRLRAGSVVLPLHHPAAVVESWAMVDGMSGGRVDLGIASGWNADDFVLAPSSFANLRDLWFERLDLVRKLWQGEPCRFANGRGELTSIQTYPRPVQSSVNLWMAISKQADSFVRAGELGVNILTMLAGSNLEQLSEKIQMYRAARERCGHDPEAGTVTLMLHTYLHPDAATVERVVREPFLKYIRSSLSSHVHGGAVNAGAATSARELDQLAEYSFERYFTTAALFGDLEDGRRMVRQVAEAGVNEIACMLYFITDADHIRSGLPLLSALARDELVPAKSFKATEREQI